VHGKRFDRHRQLKEYLEWVYSRCLPFDEVAGDTLDEWLMLRLRTQEGLSLDALQERFGAQTVDRLRIAAEPFCRSRHLAFRDDAHGISLYATDPDGWLILSHIVLELLVALEGFQDRSPARPNGNIAGCNEDALKPVLLYETSSTRAQAPNS
jgi:coproporphyrinogen III oxidase-like Fe-S oxidoreductase